MAESSLTRNLKPWGEGGREQDTARSFVLRGEGQLQSRAGGQDRRVQATAPSQSQTVPALRVVKPLGHLAKRKKRGINDAQASTGSFCTPRIGEDELKWGCFRCHLPTVGNSLEEGWEQPPPPWLKTDNTSSSSLV